MWHVTIYYLGKWACFNCVSTLSHEEVMASIQAPSTFIPTKICSPVKEQEESNIEALSCDEVMIETDTDTCLKGNGVFSLKQDCLSCNLAGLFIPYDIKIGS